MSLARRPAMSCSTNLLRGSTLEEEPELVNWLAQVAGDTAVVLVDHDLGSICRR